MSIAVFEEFRFMTQILVAEHILSIFFARKKEKFILKAVLGFLFLNLFSLLYIPLHQSINLYQIQFAKKTIILFWYILMIILSVIYIFYCYKMTISDLLFICIASFAIQHIEYVLINEIICMGLLPNIKSYAFLYIMICIISTAALYAALYKVAQNLRSCNGRIYDDSVFSISYFFIAVVVLLASSFMCQEIFLFGKPDNRVNYLGSITSFFNCTLVLVIQYTVFQIKNLNNERDIVEQLLNERKKQYQISKENMDIINSKCHDIKHHIAALKMSSKTEADQYVKEAEEVINIYNGIVKTDNEVLNTILSEKCLYCEKNKVKLTCIVDGSKLDFMSTVDIYALLGNALDNSIECVMKYDDEEKRIISLTIEAKGDFLCIQTNNYFEGNLKITNGIPETTKQEKKYHGFGIKSMQHIVEKYNGILQTNFNEDIFILQIVIPIPEECRK